MCFAVVEDVVTYGANVAFLKDLLAVHFSYLYEMKRRRNAVAVLLILI